MPESVDWAGPTRSADKCVGGPFAGLSYLGCRGPLLPFTGRRSAKLEKVAYLPSQPGKPAVKEDSGLIGVTVN